MLFRELSCTPLCASIGAVWGTRHKQPRRGNPILAKLQPNHVKILTDILHTTPVAYLDELSHELFLRTGLIVASSTIATALHNNGFTHQRLTRLHQAAVPAARVMFRERVRSWLDDLDQLVCVDETSKDRRSINRGYGWGPRTAPLSIRVLF